MTTLKFILGFIIFFAVYGLADLLGTLLAMALSHIDPLILMAGFFILFVVLIRKAVRAWF